MSNSKLTSMEPNSDPQDLPHLYPSKSYALTGKVMLSAIVILFFVVIFMICLHLYTRWYLLRARRRHLQNRQLRRHRRSHLVFYVDPSNAPTRGLDPSVLKSLPVFLYSSQTHPDSLECAVCLSEFRDNETARLLSKCNHCFHTDCIDMWFHSHSTCPLCRSPVEPAPGPVNPPQLLVSVTQDEGTAQPGSTDSESSSSSPSSAAVGTSATSFGARRKELELAVPAGNPSFVDESGCESTASQTPSFKSPMIRMLSFKRILSRERKSGVTPSGTELDIERGRGREESQETQS